MKSNSSASPRKHSPGDLDHSGVVHSVQLFAPGFFSAGNLWNIGVQAAPLLVLAIGATMVILTEGIDLSCGIVLGFAGVGFALLVQRGFPVWLAMLGGMILAGVCGLINGVLVASLHLPPFIATLGMASVITGAGLVSTEGMSIAVSNECFGVHRERRAAWASRCLF